MTTSTHKYRMLLALACESSAIGALSLETVIAVCVAADWDYDAAKANLLALTTGQTKELEQAKD